MDYPSVKREFKNHNFLDWIILTTMANCRIKCEFTSAERSCEREPATNRTRRKTVKYERRVQPEGLNERVGVPVKDLRRWSGGEPVGNMAQVLPRGDARHCCLLRIDSRQNRGERHIHYVLAEMIFLNAKFYLLRLTGCHT